MRGGEVRTALEDRQDSSDDGKDAAAILAR